MVTLFNPDYIVGSDLDSFIFFNLSPTLLQSVRRHSAVMLTVTVNDM